MRMELRALFVAALLAPPIVALPYSAAARPQDEKKQRSEAKYREKLYKEVRHQLVMLPWYSVFDNLAYQVEGDKVILSGQVTRPVLKSDAEAAVKSLEGVSSVVSNIEVLPPSPIDDQLRHALYRAISFSASIILGMLTSSVWVSVPLAPSAAVTFPSVSKMGAPRHRAPKLFSSSSTAYPDCFTCSRSASSFGILVMVSGVLFFRPCCFAIVSTSCFGSQSSRHFPTLVECKNIRRPTHVFTLKNPGASTFSM